MYRHNKNQLILPSEFFMPFEGKLNPQNRWCQLAAIIPWAEIETRYVDKLGNTNVGQRAYPARVALGALIMKNPLHSWKSKRIRVSKSSTRHVRPPIFIIQLTYGFNVYHHKIR